MIGRQELYAGAAMVLMVSALAPLGSSHAQATQQPAPAPTASGADTGSGGLEEITVTAQRRTQNIQNVPLAVTSFTAGDLEAQHITSTIDLGRVVPNMVSSNNVGQGSANAYFIRGLGQTQSFPTFEPQVSTYVDDIYISRQNANNFALFDVSQLQVLNGPQGTLFGRNSTGGAIVVTLNKPTDQYTGYIEGGYGRFNRFFGRASIDIPISEQILTKTSVFGITDDGYVHDVTTGETQNAVHNVGVREAARLLPASLDNVTWDIAADYSRSDSANAWNTISGSGDDRITYSGFTQKPGALAPYLTGDLANQAQGVVVQSWGVTSNIAATFDAGTLNFITGYRGLTQQLAIDFSGTDGTIGPVLPSDTGPVGQFALVQALVDEEYTQEIKWSGTIGDQLTYTGGAYYLFELSKDHFGEVLNLQGAIIPMPPVPVDVTGADEFTQNNTSSKALYIQGDYKVTDQLTITAGARYTDEIKDITQAHPDQPTPGVGFTLAEISQAGYETRLKAAEFTPHVSAQFQLTPDLMLFASATRGFQGGGWNGLTNLASAFNNFGPETIWSYEGGVRYQNPDHTLRFNSTFFYEDVQHYQLLSSIAGTSNFSTENTSDLIAYGLETQITYRPIDNLTLTSNIGLINAYYVNPVATVVAQQAACAASPGLQNSNCGNGIVNPEGGLATPDQVPPITFAFAASYNIDYPDFRLIPSAGVQWVAEHFVTTSGVPHGLQGAYYLLDLGVTMRLRNLPLEFTAECKNCTLTHYGTTYLSGKYYNDPGRWDIKATYNF
jgi:iron complex outermembrane receptor protein